MLASRNNNAVLVAACWLALLAPAGLCQESISKSTNAPPSEEQLALPAGEAVHPVNVSDNGRYFVDQRGRPVFWLGTTQWNLFRDYSFEDASLILERSRISGFVFVQVMLLGVGDGTKPNVYGEKPLIVDNPLTPNEAYFRNVDAVVDVARKKNVAISMTLFHQRWRNYITVDNARAWARWVADATGTSPPSSGRSHRRPKPSLCRFCGNWRRAYEKEMGPAI
jgi:Protein of unknown function (DUF4038)